MLYLRNNLRSLMQQRGMKQLALSAASGVSQERISQILSGKTENPQIVTVSKLAKGLGVSIDTLVNSTTTDTGRN